jgi:hypothetical protein
MVVTLLVVIIVALMGAIWYLGRETEDAERAILLALQNAERAVAQEHAALMAAYRTMQAAPPAPTETRVVEHVVDGQVAQQVEHARKVAGELDALLIAARDRQAVIPPPPPIVVPADRAARAIGVLSPGQKLIRARLALRQKKGKK